MNPIKNAIAGIILSAGASKRMGSPKANLTMHGKTLLQIQMNILRRAGCEEIVAVVGFEPKRIRNEHDGMDIKWVQNDDWKLGQFSSIQAGIRASASDKVIGMIILPVDVAGVKPETVAAIIETAKINDHLDAIVPEYNEREGHPIFISSMFAQKVLSTNPHIDGARLDKMLDESKAVLKIPVNDANVRNNINTPKDWNRFITSDTPKPNSDSKK